MNEINALRELCADETAFSIDAIQKIKNSGWLNVWVPRKFGGSDLSLSEGLKLLKTLAQADGSLGWTVTLCSGANYFARNMEPKTAEEIFKDKNVWFGGSGMIGGNAEVLENGYRLSGQWKYATGAPFLSHFTMNAWLLKEGKPILDDCGNPVFRSFVVPASDVKIIEDWNTMGMKATASHSFTVENIFVPENFTFQYNHFYGGEILDRITFLTFADLTMAVNYLGMAEHFAEAFGSKNAVGNTLKDVIKKENVNLFSLAEKVENLLPQNESLPESSIDEIHNSCVETVGNLRSEILNSYIALGMKGCDSNSEYNRVFRDFFTATQHSHFRKVQ